MPKKPTNRYEVLRKGGQFGKQKFVNLTESQAASFIRSGDLKEIERNVDAPDKAKTGPDAAVLKDQVAALTQQIEDKDAFIADLTEKCEQLTSDKVSLEMVLQHLEADHADAVAAAKEAVAAELAKSEEPAEG